MAKYKGKDLSLAFDTTEEINIEATSVLMSNEEADEDVTTFADVAAGGARQWFFEITAVSDYGDGSFWSFLWDNAGTDVDYLFKPYGNAAASISQPHFSGTVSCPAKPPVGGEAGSVFTFETRMEIVGEPTRVTV